MMSRRLRGLARVISNGRELNLGTRLMKVDYTSDTPEDQMPEIAKDFVHYAKKESEPWFNEITEKVYNISSYYKLAIYCWHDIQSVLILHSLQSLHSRFTVAAPDRIAGYEGRY